MIVFSYWYYVLKCRWILRERVYKKKKMKLFGKNFYDEFNYYFLVLNNNNDCFYNVLVTNI